MTLRPSASRTIPNAFEQAIATHRAVFIAPSVTAHDVFPTAYQYKIVPMGLSRATEVAPPNPPGWWAGVAAPPTIGDGLHLRRILAYGSITLLGSVLYPPGFSFGMALFGSWPVSIHRLEFPSVWGVFLWLWPIVTCPFMTSFGSSVIQF